MRDVQFSIRDYFTFAATFENGNVQLWDIRRPDRYERMFTAHNGPVFCCDWHPEDRWARGWTLLASAEMREALKQHWVLLGMESRVPVPDYLGPCTRDWALLKDESNCYLEDLGVCWGVLSLFFDKLGVSEVLGGWVW